LPKGAVVVDAGANIGIYSRFLARCVGPTGVVHSFEPSPENFSRLQRAVRKLANVRLSQAALGERSGKSNLYVSDKLNVDHRTYATQGDSRRIVPIDIIALDDYFFKSGQRVDLSRWIFKDTSFTHYAAHSACYMETLTSVFCSSFGLLAWSRRASDGKNLSRCFTA
jgi:FkbM family methyltransferase